MAEPYSTGRKTDAVVAAGADGTVIALLKRLTLQFDAGGVGTQIEGAVAAGTSNTGVNPVFIGIETGAGQIRGAFGDLLQSDAQSGSAYTLRTQGFNSVFNSAGTWDRARGAPTADAQAVTGIPATAVMAFNGTTWDRVRSPAAADGTTGAGVLAAGIMGFDATNYQALLCDTTGTQRVGRWRTMIKATPTVGTGTAYVAGDVVGTLNTLSSVVRVANGAGLLKSIAISNKSGIAEIPGGGTPAGLRLWFFDANPSGSTFTDNAALNIVDADITKVIGFVDVPVLAAAAAGAEVWSVNNIDMGITTLSGGTGLYCVLEARNPIAANAGTTDWQISMHFEQE